jgi:hypothetical protein
MLCPKYLRSELMWRVTKRYDVIGDSSAAADAALTGANMALAT